ncbi:TPA: DUF4343 domain-containing protein, partial [Streptococcus pneumoniae]|nr:DUF4343 domain-containing protein [Streptococcus pneumoniae]
HRARWKEMVKPYFEKNEILKIQQDVIF